MVEVIERNLKLLWGAVLLMCG